MCIRDSLTSQLLHEVRRRTVHVSRDCIQPKSVEVVVTKPHQRVVDEEPPHFVAAGVLEVHRITPRRRMQTRQVRRELAGIVPIRPEVVIDHVQDHGQPLAMRRIHQPLQPLRATVRLIDGKQVHPVIPPAAMARKRHHRQQFHVRNPKLLQPCLLYTSLALLALGAITATASITASAQNVDDKLLLHPTPDSWPSFHGDYSGRRHSPLTQITAANVSDLSLAWAFQTGQNAGIKSTPILVDGILYFTVPDNVWAIDARSGHLLWHYQYPPNKGDHKMCIRDRY